MITTINEYKKLNENVEDLPAKFELMVAALAKAKIPCRAKLTDREIIIECGWNYPNRIANKIFNIANLLNISDPGVCAETSEKGIKSFNICGGPKRY